MCFQSIYHPKAYQHLRVCKFFIVLRGQQIISEPFPLVARVIALAAEHATCALHLLLTLPVNLLLSSVSVADSGEVIVDRGVHVSLVINRGD